MCLGTVAKIVEMGADSLAVAEHASGEGAGRREAVLDMTDEDLQPGDWVVIHSGFALERISEARAIDALAIRATKPADSHDAESHDADSHHKEMAP